MAWSAKFWPKGLTFQVYFQFLGYNWSYYYMPIWTILDYPSKVHFFFNATIEGIIKTSLSLLKPKNDENIGREYLWLHLLHGQISQSLHRYCILEMDLWIFSPLLIFEEPIPFFTGFSVLLEQAFTAVWREDTDIICQLASFIVAGLYWFLKRRYRFYMLAF